MMLPSTFARQMLCQPFDEATARCSREWVDAAIALGRALKLPHPGDGPRARYTGVDVGGVKQVNDKSAIATVERRPDGRRRLLSLQSGHWNGPELVKRIAAEGLKYDSKIFVESNAAQKFIRDFAEAEDKRLRVVAFYTTAASKHDQWNGVESIFTEMARGCWELPHGEGDRPAVEIRDLADECVFYSPLAHMGDHLAAVWLARAGLARPGEEGAEKDKKQAGAFGSRNFSGRAGF
jgi:hypothetical protein